MSTQPRTRRAEARFCPNCDLETVHMGRRCVRCRRSAPKLSKMGNRPTRSASGAMRHSAHEADQEGRLMAAATGGAIRDLRTQVPYRCDVYGTLEVDQLLETLEAHGKLSALVRSVRLSKRHILTYRADFVWKEGQSEEDVIADAKPVAKFGQVAFRTRDWPVKKALVRACFGKDIVEL